MAIQLQEFSQSNSNYVVFAHVDLTGPSQSQILSFEFELKDPQAEVVIPKQEIQQWQRKDELWKTTCFELFVRPQTGNTYYEFNFSPSGYWNQYFFLEYRKPQPPQVSYDFELTELNWNNQTKKMRGQLKATRLIGTSYDLGLATVIEEKSGAKKYFALSHSGNKPDFHLFNSFSLKKEL